MKRFMLAFPAIVVLTAALLLAGCATKAENGALIGGGVGAGAIVGHQLGSTAGGAAIGGAVGAASGAVIGHQMDKNDRGR